MLNQVVLIGRLVRDPELRYTPQGVAVAQFDLAVDRPVRGDGEKTADFLRIVVWRKLAEVCANNLTKGRLVAVTGSIRTRSYEDRNGVRRKTFEVQADAVKFLDRKGASAPGDVEGLDNLGQEDLENLSELDDLI